MSTPPRLPAPLTAALAAVLLAVLCASAALTGCAPSNDVVVYTSQDRVYAEPLLRQFEQHTGIRVRAVYDSEAVKTVGLANRLLAERTRPQCDVFWSNEELRTRQLAAQQVFRETNGWIAVGYRSRRLALNTNLVPLAQAPRSLAELTNAAWAGKIALAYPLFGTTATHFFALHQHWGRETWTAWCRALLAHRPLVVDGNSVAARLAARGEVALALTDSDDLAVEQRHGAPLVSLPLSPESLLIPNTVAVVRAAPHPAAAQRLFEWLQSRPVLDALVQAQALEGHASADVTAPTLQPDWPAVLRDLEPVTTELKTLFLR